jgi:pteridine reductase
MQRIALVTGASRRVGAGIARQLHAGGYAIALHCRRSTSEAAALAAAFEDARPGSGSVHVADLAEPAAAAALVTEVITRWGRLDLLVNNAAAFEATPLAAGDASVFDRIIDINLRAPYLLARAAAAALQAAGGAIVNLVDVYAERPKLAHAIYCSSKAGLVGLTKALARDLAPAVRVNAVAPGAILWPEHGDAREQAEILTRIPLARCGSIEDVAGAVCYLAGALYVTGQVLAVDGGRSIYD